MARTAFTVMIFMKWHQKTPISRSKSLLLTQLGYRTRAERLRPGDRIVPDDPLRSPRTHEDAWTSPSRGLLLPPESSGGRSQATWIDTGKHQPSMPAGSKDLDIQTQDQHVRILEHSEELGLRSLFYRHSNDRHEHGRPRGYHGGKRTSDRRQVLPSGDISGNRSCGGPVRPPRLLAGCRRRRECI